MPKCKQCGEKMKEGILSEEGVEYRVWICKCGYWTGKG